jgi:methionyl-tRNA synthetase
LSEFREYLLSFLEQVRGTANARNYALGWVRDELHDWCITRTLEWGVKFPGRDDLVVYVWVDAPIGYISFTEEWAAETGQDWKTYWCGDTRVTHFIGGDIIYHHAIFWPALLKGAGYGIPQAIVASGMVKVDDHKFSKSRGYVVWTNEDYLDLGLPADYLRYYLLSYTSHTKELNFSWKVFSERVNNELVNILGNFVYRSLFFAHKEFGGIPGGQTSPEVTGEIHRCLQTVDAAMKEFEFKGAVDAVMALAAYGNNYIQTQAPWKQIKSDKSAAEKTQEIWTLLGNTDEISGHPVGEALHDLGARALPSPKPLFTRIEEKQTGDLDALLRKRVEDANKAGEKMDRISVEDFCALDIRIGTVLHAEQVPRSKKLLKLQVDLGTEKRQIVGGISQFYRPEELVGKQVVVLANLEPATILGVESNGMILAAGDTASLLIPEKPVQPGTKIR